MPCYHPITAYSSTEVNPSGKRSLVFDSSKGFSDLPIVIPCGQCIGCRLEYSRQWAVRCLHEAQLYEHNCFITLTYSDDFLPRDRSLHVDHFQRFMKRFRKRVCSDSFFKKFGYRCFKLRFFHCGEYGDNLGRPHYHACIFGFDFPDRKLFTVRDDVRLYISDELESIWENGFCTVGDVSFESAAYVARYVMKKVRGADAKAYYNGRKPEYVTMSRRPGIASGWYQKFKRDLYPTDECVVNGVVTKVPKYYDNLLEAEEPQVFGDILRSRLSRAREPAAKARNSRDRLPVREGVKWAVVNRLKRDVDF